MIFVPKPDRKIIRDISNMTHEEQFKLLDRLILMASPRKIYSSHPSSLSLCKKISLILKAGIDPDITTDITSFDEPWTPMMWCIYNSNINLVKIFIDAGADVNCERSKMTPLILAVILVEYNIVELLLKSGAKKLTLKQLDNYGLKPDELKKILNIFKTHATH